MKSFKIAIGLLFVIFICSCRSLDERNEESIENMPIEVREHVRYFVYQGNKYGKKINLKNLRVQFVTESIFSKNELWADAIYRGSEHKIIIDITSNKWKNRPRSLLLHELGHAILKRHHNNVLDSYNYPRSIMHEHCIEDYRIKANENYWLWEYFYPS